MTDPVMRADAVGRRFRSTWALRRCSFALPRGRIAALVGPNGAGKTTLLGLAAGLCAPTEGHLDVLGAPAGRRRGLLDRVSFLAQDKPLYRHLSVAEMLRAAAALNSGAQWDGAHAQQLITEAGIDPASRVGALSAGQRARVALALALGRRPELLLLDEPLAELDPLARRSVLQTLLVEVADTGLTVLLSSHVIAELEHTCDHLILLRDGRVWLSGDVEDLLADHRIVTTTSTAAATVPQQLVVHRRVTGRTATVLARTPDPAPDLHAAAPDLDELVLGYLQTTTEPEAGNEREVHG